MEPYVCSLYECKSHKETCIRQTHREEMKEQQTAGQEGIFTRKLLRNLTFAPCMNASLTKRPAFTKHIEKKWKRTANCRAGRDFHTKIVTEPYVCSLYECKSHKETCIHQTHREEMKEQQTAGQEGIFTRKLLWNLTFAPCMNASLTKRPAFTKHIEKQWKRTANCRAGRDFHTKIVTEPYVCSLYECKSHKETCIHQTHREEMKKNSKLQGRKGFSHENCYGTLRLLLVWMQVSQRDLHSPNT